MAISIQDAERLEQSGFTLEEIRTIADAKKPDGNPQDPINLSDPYWREAMRDHHNVMNAFFDMSRKHNIETTRDDYNNFINWWYTNVVREADPWVWIDQFYFRTYTGVTKTRWHDAYDKTQMLKDMIR